MRIKVRNFSIYIDGLVVIVAILSIIFKGIRDYFENYFICYLFITFHEFSHMFVASLFGVKTTRLNIRISGLSINLNERKRQGLKWMFIFLAGPISNIVLAFIFKKIPMVYTINLVLAVINLVPIYPLDGYNILKILLIKMKIDSRVNIQNVIQIIIIIVLGILGFYQVIFLHNLSLILMFFYIFIQCSSLRKNWNSGMYQKCYKNITNF